MAIILQLLLAFTAIFLILLILVQRGRGGGLAGALGGPGGSSAFGAKAGDAFTRITIYAASFWICLCIGAAYWAGHQGDLLGEADAKLTSGSAPASGEPGANLPVEGMAPIDGSTPAGDSSASDSAATDSAASETAPAEQTEPASEPAAP